MIDTALKRAEVRGYSLNDLDRLARTVVVANAQWWPGGDRYDQADTAWHGIVEHLYSASDAPTERDLLAAGTRALTNEVNGHGRHHGRTKDGTGTTAPRFAAYWYEPAAEPWEDRVIERIAAEQILTRVKPHQTDALLALAAHGDYAAAAEALGLKYATLTVRLSGARRTFQEHWYAPERPPSTRGTDRRVGSRAKPLPEYCKGGDGPHLMTPENTRWNKGRTAASAKVRRCRACQADRDRARKAATA